MNILAFGIAREIVGGSNIQVVVDKDISAESLKSLLKQTYPPLQKLRSFMLAVNNKYAEDDQVILISDEIAIIPPVSGG